eukprot:TRINITY_DN13355_c0_g1_i1.p2 TRINITY_DN13355_c0_g1~~TRINITY_DN13355_c0_g1_i1.p2  ORF type:complete len:116 (-),score=22.11 TRINITY_DN13355_c0_g1_i1:247-594(-)
MFQFGFHKCAARKGKLTHWQKWDAAYCLGLAVPLTLAMPLAVVLIYVGKLNYPESKMWFGGSWFPNTHHGRIVYTMKWFGVVVLTIGVFKATGLHRKLIKKWKELRSGDDAELKS